MTKELTRRTFGLSASSMAAATILFQSSTQDKPTKSQMADTDSKKKVPMEADFERDYAAPKFKPSWKKPQINRTMAADFVIYAHSNLEMVKKLYDREPGLLNATLDWGGGDWEDALGGASHMGRKDIVKFLLSKGARINIFSAAMLGMTATVKEMLTFAPNLIDAKGPHGFTLHFHAQVGQEDSKAVLDYLQSIREEKLRPIPFLKKKPPTDSK